MGKLTNAAIKAWKPNAPEDHLPDGGGLSLRARTDAAWSWVYRYRVGGKAGKVTLGTYPAMSLAAARAAHADARRLVQAGTAPVAEKAKKREAVRAPAASAETATVALFAERYMRELVERDRKAPAAIRRYLDKDVLPFIGDKLVAELTTEDVRGVIWRKKEHGFDAAAAGVRGVLKRMLDYAQTCGLVSSNPVLALPARHVFKAQGRERNLSMAEVGVFLRALYDSNVRRQFKIAGHLYLLTMMRKSALLQARWDEVDLDAGEWTVPPSSDDRDTKNRQPVVVYLSRQARELFAELKRLAGGSALVMPGRGSLTKPFAHKGPNDAIKRAMKGTDVPAFTVHDLRRTARSRLADMDWPESVIEKAMGHVFGGVRGIYNRAQYATQRREMLQQWADMVDAAREGAKVVPLRQASGKRT